MSEDLRTYKTRAFLTSGGYGKLDRVLYQQHELYNCALKNRRNAYEESKRSVTFAEQSRELTHVRTDHPDFAVVDRRLQIGTLRRLDRAFQSFFRRVKAGEKPGYPRFKAKRRFRTMELYSGDRRFVKIDAQTHKGKLLIKGLPTLRFYDDRMPTDRQPLDIKITRSANSVWVAMSFEVGELPQAESGPPLAPVGIDLGVRNRAICSDGSFYGRASTNDYEREKRRLRRRLARQRDAAIEDRRAEYHIKGYGKDGKPRFRFRWFDRSRRYDKTVDQLARLDDRQAVRRKSEIHQITSSLVKRHDLVVHEDLAIKNITRSARGTEEEPGRNVKAKSGLNREILAQGWGIAIEQLTYKAASAGRRVLAVNPAYTSQGCAKCGVVDAASRRGERFTCSHCGHSAHADVNAAKNILARGLAALPGCGAGEPTPQGASECESTVSVGTGAPGNPAQMGLWPQ